MDIIELFVLILFFSYIIYKITKKMDNIIDRLFISGATIAADLEELQKNVFSIENHAYFNCM